MEHIRRYVLDRDTVQDLRTGVLGTPARVLEGDLDEFIEAALKWEMERARARALMPASQRRIQLVMDR